MSDSFRSQTNINLDRYIFRVQREIPFDTADLEKLLHENKHFQDLITEEERQADWQATHEKRRQLVEQLFTAASKTLTDIQYQIFCSYYVLGMSEIQIAESFSITQPYVSIVLSASIKKIRKHLRLT
jgi:DNA-directed RNA polymerase specialized sigma subunit